MTTPLSDERLAEIGQFLESHADGRGHCDGANWRYVHSASTGLLAEVSRLRARIAELEDVYNRAQAMADRMAEQAADNLLRAREAERRVARLKDVLRRIGTRWTVMCMECGHEVPGHRPDCALDAALNAGTPSPSVPATTAP